jgi:hypothetical protein
MLALFYASGATAQTTPAPAIVEWGFSTPSIVPGFGNDDNWSLAVIQTSDGNFVSAGFSDKFAGCTTTSCGFPGTFNHRYPAVMKFSPTNGGQVLWETIPAKNDNIPSSSIGGYNDLFEFSKNGRKYIFASGQILRSGDKKPVFTIFDLETGEVAQNDAGVRLDYEPFRYLDGMFGRAINLQPIYDINGNVVSVFACGQIQLPNDIFKAAVYKIKLDFNDFGLDVNFNGNGFVQIDPVHIAKVGYLTDIILNQNGRLVGSGWVRENADPNTVAKNAYVFSMNQNGSMIWDQEFDEDFLEGLSLYTDETPDLVSECKSIDLETNHEEAFSIRQLEDGSYATYCRFDFAELGCAAVEDCDPYEKEQYYDADMAIVRLTEVLSPTGSSINFQKSLGVGRSKAIDYWSHMVQAEGNQLFLLGATEKMQNNDNLILGSVVKVNFNGTEFENVWRKDFQTSASALEIDCNGNPVLKEAEYFCPFNICPTNDGGLLICGNNELNGDDYDFIKLNLNYDNANPCLDVTQTATNITNVQVWNSAKTVKGTITIKAGGELTIQNTTITFANTYTTNDLADVLANSSNFNPTKIVVEPGGKLNLDNCILKGSECNGGEMWEGIIVLGNNTASPSLSNQGKVKMRNNAQIKDSYYGISAGDRVYNSAGRSQENGLQGGGIVDILQPSGSTAPHFLNCRVSLSFAPYYWSTTNYGSTIRNANFVCNSVLKDPLYANLQGTRIGSKYFVTINSRPTALNFCSFKGLNTLDWEDQTKAIETYDANVFVYDSKFEKLGYTMIYTNPTNSSKKLIFGGNEMIGIPHGVVMSASNLGSFINNRFLQIPNGAAITLLNQNEAMKKGAYGILSANSIGTEVLNVNVFEGQYTANATDKVAYGIIMQNSNAIASQTFENTFKNINFGIQTQQNNGGYQIRCNTFLTNGFAMNINPLSPMGVFNHQGICGTFDKQAGNKFSDANCISQSANKNHINSTINFEYRFRDNYPNEDPICINVNKVTKVLCGTNGGIYPYSCDDGIDPCDIWQCRVALLRTNISTAEGWKKEILQEKLIRELSAQDSVDSSNEILTLIQDLDNDTEPLMYIGALIDYGQFANAQELISSLSNTTDGTALKFVYNTTLAMRQQHQSVFQLTENQVNTLKGIAEGNTKANHYAQAILQARGEEVLNIPIEPTILEDDAPRIQYNNSSSNQGILSIVPNPSNGESIIKWNLSGTFKFAKIKVTDVRGIILKEFTISDSVGDYDLSNLHLNTGIYFVKLQSDSQDLVTKVIISR